MREYDYDTFTHQDAKALNGKVVTITTYDHAEWPDGEPAATYRRVRVWSQWSQWSLLVLADGEPGPADRILLEVIKTVEVHE